MNLEKFIKQLSSLYRDWELPTAYPKSNKFRDLSLHTLFYQTLGITPINTMQLLNFAVDCMEEEEVYCQLGCLPVDSLVAALIDTNRNAYAIHDIAVQNQELGVLSETITQFELEENIFFASEGFEKFFLDLQDIESEDKIGVFFLNQVDDYRSLFLSLILVKKFLSDRALIVLNQSKSNLVRQVAWDFFAAYPQCSVLLDLPFVKNEDVSFGNGLLVLSWDNDRGKDGEQNNSWIDRQQEFKLNLNIPTIYIACPDLTAPTGGVKQLYRHVDILNKNGFSAAIIHKEPGFRCTWFENNTTIADPDPVITRNDYLALAECNTSNIHNVTPGIRKVILNQNAYLGFSDYPLDEYSLPVGFLHREVTSVISVSQDNAEYLSYVFPDLQIDRIHHGIDPLLFAYRANKKKQICFMPRKNVGDAIQVINILKYRDVLEDFTIVPIDNKTISETAEIMAESLIFLSFGYPEGFGLPPAEAMACGCIVIGYHGMGGKEFFKPKFSYPIEVGDIIGFAKTIETVIKHCDRDPRFLLEKGRHASEFIHAEYSLAREEADIVAVWHKILSKEDRYLKHATVIQDFAEFSGLSIPEIERRIFVHHTLAGEEWHNVVGQEFNQKSQEFYKNSSYYIYDLLSVNYNKTALISKLNSICPGMLNLIRQHPGKDFLEFGGGTGLFCEQVFNLGKNVTYLDIPGQVLNFAKWRFAKYQLPIDLICSQPDCLKLDRSFDIIFSDAVFEHLIDPEQVLSELCDHTKPDGLIILLIDLSGHTEEFPMHREIDIIALHQLIRAKGFVNLVGENSFCSIWQKQI